MKTARYLVHDETSKRGRFGVPYMATASPNRNSTMMMCVMNDVASM